MRSTSTCYCCLQEISSASESLEHIIPNAIGGHLRAKHVLCIRCNSDLGRGVDAAACADLSELANLLDLERDRGRVQPIIVRDVEGKEYLREPKGDIRLRRATSTLVQDHAGKTAIDVSGPTMKAVRNELRRYLKDFPHLDVEAAMQQMRPSSELIESAFTMETGLRMDELRRCATKIAASYFVYTGGAAAVANRLVDEINGVRSCQAAQWYEAADPVKAGPRRISHILWIPAREPGQRVVCFVELFTFARFAVDLGPAEVQREATTYAYDLVAESNLDLSFCDDAVETLEGVLRNAPDIGAMRGRFAEVVGQASSNSQLSRIIRDAFAEVMSTTSDPTTEHLWPVLWPKLEKWILPRIAEASRRRREADRARFIAEHGVDPDA
jgi:hypothetical protein